MKIGRLYNNDQLMTVFEHSDGQWYDAAEVLPDARHYLEDWPATLAALQSMGPDHRPLKIEGHHWALPFQPTTFRDFYAFEEHVKTCRANRGMEMNQDWYAVPVFYFSNPYSFVPHQAEVHAPQGCSELDYELELGLVIGRHGKNISPDRAWDYVAGLTILNDFSARDLQRKEMSLQLGPAKGKDFATAMGPWLVTLDEVAERMIEDGNVALEMQALRNGKLLSEGNASRMYHSWPQIIAHASRDVELRPGDVLGSGTVGSGCILELGAEHAGGWLRPGDDISLRIEGLGQLDNHIVERPQDGHV